MQIRTNRFLKVRLPALKNITYDYLQPENMFEDKSSCGGTFNFNIIFL